MNSMTMDQNEISCSPALTDEDFSEETISFSNNGKLNNKFYCLKMIHNFFVITYVVFKHLLGCVCEKC